MVLTGNWQELKSVSMQKGNHVTVATVTQLEDVCNRECPALYNSISCSTLKCEIQRWRETKLESCTPAGYKYPDILMAHVT